VTPLSRNISSADPRKGLVLYGDILVCYLPKREMVQRTRAERDSVITILTVKLSIGAFLLRIVQSKHQRYTVYGVLLVNILFSIVYLCLVIFQCTPISHFVSFDFLTMEVSR
jgi:hypothetical protein